MHSSFAHPGQTGLHTAMFRGSRTYRLAAEGRGVCPRGVGLPRGDMHCGEHPTGIVEGYAGRRWGLHGRHLQIGVPTPTVARHAGAAPGGASTLADERPCGSGERPICSRGPCITLRAPINQVGRLATAGSPSSDPFSHINHGSSRPGLIRPNHSRFRATPPQPKADSSGSTNHSERRRDRCSPAERRRARGMNAACSLPLARLVVSQNRRRDVLHAS